MRVVVAVGGRSPLAAGLEHAEERLLRELAGRRDGLEVGVRAVGGRGARRYARRLGGRWVPARPGTAPRRAWRGADLVHLAGLGLPPPARTPFVATFHDLAALAYPDEGELPGWAADVAARASLLLCPSSFTASELEGRLGVPPERIRVVPNGPGHEVSPATPPLDGRERVELGLPDRFILRIGGYTRRKNVGLLLEAWARIPGTVDAELVLAGPPHAAREAILAAAPSLDRVRVVDYVPDDLLPRLLRSARAVVTTSVYEGFGMTPLEAMAAGVPAVAVATEASREVCGDAALLVPDDADAVAAALQAVSTDEGLCARLAESGLRRAAGFTWERAAELVRDAYRDIVPALGRATTPAVIRAPRGGA